MDRARAESVAQRVEHEIETWFSDHLRGGAVARHTDAYNQVFSAKADLIDRIKTLFADDARGVADAILTDSGDTADGEKTADANLPE